jgi:hypothetical protein
MIYTIKDIEKITNFKTWSDRQKVDELLRIDADIYCNLGSESTKADKEEAKKKSKKIYRAIKDIDYLTGLSFLHVIDL